LPPWWQQQEVRSLISLSDEWQAYLHANARARSYLLERAIPLEVALSAGVGYLPATSLFARKCPQLARWADRLIFPLQSQEGHGFIGRSLWGWKPGMDERRHKHLLDQAGAPPRWIKTNPAGWFAVPEAQLADSLVVVEGAFDRLALLACGVPERSCVALAGITAGSAWFPPQVKKLVLALDSDPAGRDATLRLMTRFEQAGIGVKRAIPPTDQWGKDFSERYRRIGSQCVWPLYEALHAIQS